MRIAALGVLRAVGLGAIGLALASLPAAAQSTTRIETRPFYGATVTIEEGVRVFRPLPPHDRVIINPDKVPLTLSFTQSYNYSFSHHLNQVVGEGSGPRQGYAYFAGAHGRRHPGHHEVGGKR